MWLLHYFVFMDYSCSSPNNYISYVYRAAEQELTETFFTTSL
jgi:hypothetical protein